MKVLYSPSSVGLETEGAGLVHIALAPGLWYHARAKGNSKTGVSSCVLATGLSIQRSLELAAGKNSRYGVHGRRVDGETMAWMTALRSYL